MTRKTLFLLICCLMLFLVGCDATDPSANAQTANGSSAQSLGNTNIVVVNSSTGTVMASSENPTSTPTTTNSQPTATPTSPPAQPTPTSAPTTTGYHSCAVGAGNCSNPWNYVLGCGCGIGWQPVRTSPSGFCSWFQCIPNFDNGNGVLGECGDGQMTHSAGISGSCSGHGALIGELYYYDGVTPTPTPQTHSTPTAIATP